MIKKTNKNKGFTLIELLVVISIIGLLSSITLASLQSARQKANAAKVVAEMNQLKTAFELYRNDKGEYPNEKLGGHFSSLGVVNFLKTELVNNNYISSIPSLASPSNEFYYLSGINGFNQTSVTYSNGDSYLCGGKKINSFILTFYYDKMSLDFPKAGFIFDDDTILNVFEDWEGNDLFSNFYCIGE